MRCTRFIKIMHRIIYQVIVVFNDFINFIIFLNPLLKASPKGEYSNLTFSTIPGLYPKSSTVKYSYLSNSLDDNADNLACFSI